MEPVYIIGAGAIGKVLAVCLANNGKEVVLLRGSVDNDETRRENIRVTLSSQETIEATVTIDTLSNYRSLEGLIVLCNKSYGNAALARAVSPIGRVIGVDETSLDHIAALLNTPYFGFRPERDIQPIIWKKAIINSVFNSVCPLLDTDNGIFHRNREALQIAESLVTECLGVAEEQGVRLNRAEVMDSLLLISRSSDGQFISTLQDIRNHRPTEIATLNLAIAGMAATEQDIIQTLLLGKLTLLKSQLASRQASII
jgi:2-dehydropantoate 2-reductase